MFELLPGYNVTPMTNLAMQLPMFSHGSAHAIDWNGDGYLDLFHHNHFGTKRKGFRRWSDPAIDRQKGKLFVDWDAVLCHGNNGTYYSPKGGFVESSDTPPLKVYDAHSSAFLDIDGDGIEDFYIVTGGGHGIGNSKVLDNALFWGVKDNKSEIGYRLVGGRNTALKAGLHARNQNGNQRGRHHYWFDADGDGLLDVVTLNTERKDGKLSPGRFYRNLNGRKFKESRTSARNFTEYATMAVLTDLNGDGFAHELVVPSQCHRTSKDMLCKRSPRLSLSVYLFDSDSGDLRRRTLNTKRPIGVGSYDTWMSIATEDFDLDGKPDVAMLSGKRIHFYLSSARHDVCNRIKDNMQRQYCLLYMGEPATRLDLVPMCGKEGAKGIRFADFNLNGRIDMLVVCATPGKHGMYELVSSKTWSRLKESSGNLMKYGALNSLNNVFGPKGFCSGVPTTKKDVRKNNKCTKFLSAAQCSKLKYKWQFAICSIHKQKRVEAFPPTVADLDNDGFYDIILGYHYGSMVIVRNTLKDKGNKNRFLAVRVDKKAGPAASIGAILKLTSSKMGRHRNETVTQLRVVSTLSHETDAEGGVDNRKIFGLGAGGRPIKLNVQWPHCCQPTIIGGSKLLSSVNSMDSPYDVPAPPKNCDRSCFKK